MFVRTMDGLVNTDHVECIVISTAPISNVVHVYLRSPRGIEYTYAVYTDGTKEENEQAAWECANLLQLKIRGREDAS